MAQEPLTLTVRKRQPTPPPLTLRVKKAQPPTPPIAARPSFLERLETIPGVTKTPEVVMKPVRAAGQRAQSEVERLLRILPESVAERVRKPLAQAAGFYAGGTEGLAEYLGNLRGLATAVPIAATTKVARAVTGLPFVAGGAGRVARGVRERKWGDVGWGATEAAAGLLGLKGRAAPIKVEPSGQGVLPGLEAVREAKQKLPLLAEIPKRVASQEARTVAERAAKASEQAWRQRQPSLTPTYEAAPGKDAIHEEARSALEELFRPVGKPSVSLPPPVTVAPSAVTRAGERTAMISKKELREQERHITQRLTRARQAKPGDMPPPTKQGAAAREVATPHVQALQKAALERVAREEATAGKTAEILAGPKPAPERLSQEFAGMATAPPAAQAGDVSDLLERYLAAQKAYKAIPAADPTKIAARQAYQALGRRLMEETEEARKVLETRRGLEGIPTKPSSEAGRITPGALQTLLHLSGGVAGGVAGAKLDEEHPVRGAVTGALLGAAAPSLPSAVRHPVSYFLSNILSSLRTQSGNVSGNIAKAAVNPLVSLAGEATIPLKSGYKVGETLAALKGTGTGLVKGARYGLEDLLRGPAFREARLKTKYQAMGQPTSQFDRPITELSGGLANPLNLPGRGLNAVDTLFSEINEAQRLSQLRFNPHGMKPTEVVLNANKYAAENVFRGDPGQIANKVIDLKRKGGFWGVAADFLIPFVRTRVNLLKQGIVEYSPLGFMTKAAKQEGLAGTEAKLKAGVGTGLLAYPAYLASTGQLYGYGPRDPIERAAWLEQGGTPYSVKVGEKYIPYTGLGPFANSLALLADGFESYRHERDAAEKSGDVGAVEVAKKTALGIASTYGQSVVRLSPFDALARLQDATARGDPESLQEFINNFGLGFAPMSGFMRNLAQAGDPTVREAKGFGEKVKSITPGLSETLPARLTRWGKPMVRPGGFMERLLSPAITSPAQRDPVVSELQRLGLRVGKPSGDVTVWPGTRRSTKLDLEGAEANKVVGAKGQANYSALERIIKGQYYEKLTDEQRTRRLRQVLARTRSRTTQQLQRQYRGVAREQQQEQRP